MKTSNKTLGKAIVGNILLLGLVACASSPAPWSRPDTSPWSEKRASEASAAPADDIVVQAPIIEPIDQPPPPPELYEPEPMVSEPAAIDVPPPAAVTASSVVSDINNEQRVLNMPASAYAVQAYAATSEATMDKFKADKGLENMLVVKTDRDGKTMYVLVGLHDTRDSATQWAKTIEAQTGVKPWVRGIAGLQKVVQQ